jgi:hypothetical protein
MELNSSLIDLMDDCELLDQLGELFAEALKSQSVEERFFGRAPKSTMALAVTKARSSAYALTT